MATNLFSPAGDRGVESWCREPEDGQLLASAKSGQAAALAELCRSYAKKILHTTSHYQESGRCGTGRFLHIEHFEERSSFSTWLTRIAINSALMISRRRRNFSEIPAKDSGGRWLVSGNRGQRSESGKALPGAKAGAACAKGNPKFATQHPRGSGDATLARLFGRGNSARDEHLGWRCQGAALSRQEGPAQSSEPEKHRGQQVQGTTNDNEIANGRRLRWIADSRSGCSRYHWVPAHSAGCSVWRAGFSSCPSW